MISGPIPEISVFSHGPHHRRRLPAQQSTTCSTWSCSPPSARAASPTAPDARVDWENDKPTVVALREIADGKVTIDLLSEPDPEPEQELIPENPLDLGVDFRAPQLGLGD